MESIRGCWFSDLLVFINLDPFSVFFLNPKSPLRYQKGSSIFIGLSFISISAFSLVNSISNFSTLKLLKNDTISVSGLRYFTQLITSSVLRSLESLCMVIFLFISDTPKNPKTKQTHTFPQTLSSFHPLQEGQYRRIFAVRWFRRCSLSSLSDNIQKHLA